MAVLGCSYLGSQNIIIIHQLLAKITTIEEEESRKLNEKNEEIKKKEGLSEKESEKEKAADNSNNSMQLLSQHGFGLGFGDSILSSGPAPNKEELDNISKEGV